MPSGNIFSRSVLAICAIGILGNILVFSSEGSELSKNGVPHLKKRGNVTQLIIDGKPFLILAGELGNSSSSSLDYMKPIWPSLVQMNLNTVLAPV
jgi:hypothetical protein